MVRLDLAAVLGASLAGTALGQTYGNGTSSNSSLEDALYKDASQSVEARVEDLLSYMTLDEKVAQLMQGNKII